MAFTTSSLELLRAALPFWYVRYYRYYRGLRLGSYLIGDLAPIILYVWLFSGHVNWSLVLLAWLLFWSFYEIGYLENDVKSVARESLPSIRLPESVHRAYAFIVVVRLAQFLMLAAAMLSLDSSVNGWLLASYVAVTAITFKVHNGLKQYQGRLVTLVGLGVLKPIFVPGVLGLDVAGLVCVMVPSLIVKLFDYASKKGFADHPLRENFRARLLMHLGFVPPLALIDFRLLIVLSPILLAVALVPVVRYLTNRRPSGGMS